MLNMLRGLGPATAGESGRSAAGTGAGGADELDRIVELLTRLQEMSRQRQQAEQQSGISERQRQYLRSLPSRLRGQAGLTMERGTARNRARALGHDPDAPYVRAVSPAGKTDAEYAAALNAARKEWEANRDERRSRMRERTAEARQRAGGRWSLLMEDVNGWGVTGNERTGRRRFYRS